jgi:NADH:ubiquinone oxidoreductase subunit 3 (subunit A)
MDKFLLAPPVAFVIYVALVAILSGFGRILAGAGSKSPAKMSTYAAGESSPTRPAVPGYRPFFVVALFFAVLHLGVLVLGSGDLSSIVGIYLVGLILALVALILG